MARALARSLILCQISLLVLSAVSAADGQGAFGDRRDEAGSTTSNIGMAGESIREVLASTMLASAASRFVTRNDGSRNQISDLTQYPGQSASIPLYFRSMALRNGSTLMFDVRGYVTVTRQ
jgi:hypothetical protein